VHAGFRLNGLHDSRLMPLVTVNRASARPVGRTPGTCFRPPVLWHGTQPPESPKHSTNTNDSLLRRPDGAGL